MGGWASGIPLIELEKSKIAIPCLLKDVDKINLEAFSARVLLDCFQKRLFDILIFRKTGMFLGSS